MEKWNDQFMLPTVCKQQIEFHLKDDRSINNSLGRRRCHVVLMMLSIKQLVSISTGQNVYMPGKFFRCVCSNYKYKLLLRELIFTHFHHSECGRSGENCGNLHFKTISYLWMFLRVFISLSHSQNFVNLSDRRHSFNCWIEWWRGIWWKFHCSDAAGSELYRRNSVFFRDNFHSIMEKWEKVVIGVSLNREI